MARGAEARAFDPSEIDPIQTPAPETNTPNLHLVEKQPAATEAETLEQRLDRTRLDYLSAKHRVNDLQKLRVKILRHVKGGESPESLQAQFRQASETYKETRAEYIGTDVERFIGEREKILEASVEVKQKNIIRRYHNKLGEIKVFDNYEAKGKFAKTKQHLSNMANARTLAGAGLTGLGVATGGAGLVAKKVFSGTMAGVGAYELALAKHEAWGRAKIQEQLQTCKTSAEAAELMDQMRVRGGLDGKNGEEIRNDELYVNLKNKFTTLLTAETGKIHTPGTDILKDYNQTNQDLHDFLDKAKAEGWTQERIEAAPLYIVLNAEEKKLRPQISKLESGLPKELTDLFDNKIAEAEANALKHKKDEKKTRRLMAAGAATVGLVVASGYAGKAIGKGLSGARQGLAWIAEQTGLTQKFDDGLKLATHIGQETRPTGTGAGLARLVDKFGGWREAPIQPSTEHAPVGHIPQPHVETTETFRLPNDLESKPQAGSTSPVESTPQAVNWETSKPSFEPLTQTPPEIQPRPIAGEASKPSFESRVAAETPPTKTELLHNGKATGAVLETHGKNAILSVGKRGIEGAMQDMKSVDPARYDKMIAWMQTQEFGKGVKDPNSLIHRFTESFAHGQNLDRILSGHLQIDDSGAVTMEAKNIQFMPEHAEAHAQAHAETASAPQSQELETSENEDQAYEKTDNQIPKIKIEHSFQGEYHPPATPPTPEQIRNLQIRHAREMASLQVEKASHALHLILDKDARVFLKQGFGLNLKDFDKIGNRSITQFLYDYNHGNADYQKHFKGLYKAMPENLKSAGSDKTIRQFVLAAAKTFKG